MVSVPCPITIPWLFASCISLILTAIPSQFSGFISSEANENRGSANTFATSSRALTELTNCSAVIAGLTAPVL